MDSVTGQSRRRFDRERTRQEILDAARQEFSERGLDGARVEAIAARTNVVKRMIYYYFGSKEGLYLAVLEDAYAAIREAEQNLALEGLHPVAALERLVDFTFDYDDSHPDFIRLVSIENIQNGTHMARSDKIKALNSTALTVLADILRRGQQQGLFRAEIEPIELHLLISSLCFFRVSNRHTFSLLFDHDLSRPQLRERHKQVIKETVVRSLAVVQARAANQPRAPGPKGGATPCAS